MSAVIITVEGLGKRYRLGSASRSNERYTALRDVIAEKATGLLEKLKLENLQSRKGQEFSVGKPGCCDASVTADSQDISGSRLSDEFWALKDVSFEVKQGEVLGIIGRNGAGKSTLLKILSRITEPTKGRVKIKGRVASLLEVGTGFHPELTGRENIYLNGAILGMHRNEIKSKFDEIVAFAEVEKFLDTPVKRYSSGMYVRLAFAVAAHLEPEILVVDEVLAVGDAEFQKKCLGKMQQVAKGEGRTVLFVSHNMIAVQSLCRRALWLSEGRVALDEKAPEVVSVYLQGFRGRNELQQWDDPSSAPGNDLLRIKSLRLSPDSSNDCNQITMQTPVRIELEYWILGSDRQLHITYHLFNEQGIVVLTSGFPTLIHRVGLHRAICRIPGDLLNSGGYYLKLLLVENGNSVIFTLEDLASFNVVDLADRKGAWLGREPGVVQPHLEWTVDVLTAL